MKIVAISRVKVEADILEAFVRHNGRFVDLMLVMDDASTDGSLAILEALADEGLNLLVFSGKPGAAHREALMELLGAAFGEHGADWVLPLDSDEFIEISGGGRLHDLLPAAADLPHSVCWQGFVYKQVAAIDGLPDVIARLPYRVPANAASTKVIIPKTLGLTPGFTLHDGSHESELNGKILPRVAIPQMVLCHFPIRSVEQFSKKAVLGRWLSIFTRGNHTTHAAHYWEPYEVLKRGDDIEPVMFQLSLNYSAEPVHDEADVYFEPLRYQGGDCRYQGKIIKTSLHHDMCLAAEMMGMHAFSQPLSPLQIRALKDVSRPRLTLRPWLHAVLPPRVRRGIRRLMRALS